jgi:hypothetical protein
MNESLFLRQEIGFKTNGSLKSSCDQYSRGSVWRRATRYSLARLNQIGELITIVHGPLAVHWATNRLAGDFEPIELYHLNCRRLA